MSGIVKLFVLDDVFDLHLTASSSIISTIYYYSMVVQKDFSSCFMIQFILLSSRI